MTNKREIPFQYTEKQKQLVRLAREAGDTDKEFMAKVRGMLPGMEIVSVWSEDQLNNLQFMLNVLEREFYPLGGDREAFLNGQGVPKDGEKRIDVLFQQIVCATPFHISLDNMDKTDGSVTIYTRLKMMAVHDQTINGSMWEAPGDLDVAYACTMDEPGLVQKLEAEGYVVNEDNYCRSDSWEELRANNPDIEEAS
jgi:hypothetical protein